MDETLIHRSFKKDIHFETPLCVIPAGSAGNILTLNCGARPFVEHFLKELSSIYELVIFTASYAQSANVVIDKLDPDKKYISHRIYKDNCTIQGKM